MIKGNDKKYVWGSGHGSGNKVCYRNVRNEFRFSEAT